MRFTLLLLVLLFGSAFASIPHDYHVSITKIDLRPERTALEVTVKLFTDDLERSLELMGAPRLKIGDGAEHPRTDSIISAYLENRLKMEVDGQELPRKFIGKEVELDATWCYLEFGFTAGAKQLIVTNKILTELFPDQSNMVHVDGPGLKKSLLMDGTTCTGAVFF